MPHQVDGALVHALSGNELSRVRTEFQPRPPEPINQCLLESRGPTLLCNHVVLGGFHFDSLRATSFVCSRCSSCKEGEATRLAQLAPSSPRTYYTYYVRRHDSLTCL
jgi:hypothetical protein